jgi:LmbE family N-acetylglucosaminyl deacetylase
MKLLLGMSLFASLAQPAPKLPLAEIPPGKTVIAVYPHHDDHTHDAGSGGFIAKLIDNGYTGNYVRVSNDEKDGPHGWGGNDTVNYTETVDAIRHLGLKEVISLNWRNDHMDSLPVTELRAQLILLFRKYRPDVVLSYDPYGHYDRNPDHRKVSRAVAEAVWLSGYANVHPEHGTFGVQPYRPPFRYYSQRTDYGRGHEPNIAVELSESQVKRKAVAFWLHKNVRLLPATARRIRQQLDAKGLAVPELEGLDDLEATKRIQEWSMFWISAERGRENAVKYAEVFYRIGEWDHLPGLREYIEQNAKPK